jgi:hypothetical protein
MYAYAVRGWKRRVESPREENIHRPHDKIEGKNHPKSRHVVTKTRKRGSEKQAHAVVSECGRQYINERS